jgi:hypothetical protein
MRKLIGLLMLVCAGSVNAATAVMSGGKLIGATGVEVNGASYDVAFLDGSCNSLYNGCTGLPFTTSSEGLAASQALIDQVLQPPGISRPDLINGIGPYPPLYPSDTYAAFILTPAAESWGVGATGVIGGSTFVPWYAFNELGPDGAYTADTSSPTSPYLYDGGAIFDEVFAVWTPAAVSAVPLPAAAWLFISAIAGLAGAKRLSRSKGSA